MLWTVFQIVIGIPVAICCLAILISETIRCFRIVKAMIKNDQETINDLWL